MAVGMAAQENRGRGQGSRRASAASTGAIWTRGRKPWRRQARSERVVDGSEGAAAVGMGRGVRAWDGDGWEIGLRTGVE